MIIRSPSPKESRITGESVSRRLDPKKVMCLDRFHELSELTIKMEPLPFGSPLTRVLEASPIGTEPKMQRMLVCPHARLEAHQ